MNELFPKSFSEWREHGRSRRSQYRVPERHQTQDGGSVCISKFLDMVWK